MGVLIDSSVLIAWERDRLDLESRLADYAEEDFAISAITASELLHGATAPMFTTFQLHPYMSSRLGGTSALKEMIEYMKGHEGVWFATGIEIAEWWLKQNFSEKPAPLRMAAVS